MNIQRKIETELRQKITQLYNQMKLNISINQNILNGLGYTPAGGVVINFPKKTMADIIKNTGKEMNSDKFAITAVCSTVGVFYSYTKY